MTIYNTFNKKSVAKILSGGIGVIPTDTIYGLVASAINQKAVEKLYKIKNRQLKKPFIILISDIGDLNMFGIKLDLINKSLMESYWPGANSLILKCVDVRFDYLSRGTKKLAFRLPDDSRLRSFIEATGPLVAPSANPEGTNPAHDVIEALNYFSDEVDFYIDLGFLDGKPSNLIDLTGKEPIILR